VNAIDSEPVPDEELVQRLAEGRREAMDPLHTRYGPLLTQMAARHLDRPAAEEIVQDVFLTVWQRAATFDSRRGSFRPWVVQITRRRIINELRRRRSRPKTAADPDGVFLERMADEAPEVADQLVVEERRSAVRGALQVLPQPQREAVALAFLEDLTHEQVASALRAPLGTTKTRIRSGLMKLRVELMSIGVAVLMTAVSSGLAWRYVAAETGFDRDERALSLVTTSDLVPVRLAPVVDLPAGAHGHYRSRAGAETAVLTVSNLPPAPHGSMYTGWASTADNWTALGTLMLDDSGAGRLISEAPGLATPPDEVEVTLESNTTGSAPAGQTVLAWSATQHD
jgi:RNA polymerase sigma factor (sigma-70 family)